MASTRTTATATAAQPVTVGDISESTAMLTGHETNGGLWVDRGFRDRKSQATEATGELRPINVFAPCRDLSIIVQLC